MSYFGATYNQVLQTLKMDIQSFESQIGANNGRDVINAELLNSTNKVLSMLPGAIIKMLKRIDKEVLLQSSVGDETTLTLGVAATGTVYLWAFYLGKYYGDSFDYSDAMTEDGGDFTIGDDNKTLTFSSAIAGDYMWVASYDCDLESDCPSLQVPTLQLAIAALDMRMMPDAESMARDMYLSDSADALLKAYSSGKATPAELSKLTFINDLSPRKMGRSGFVRFKG